VGVNKERNLGQLLLPLIHIECIIAKKKEDYSPVTATPIMACVVFSQSINTAGASSKIH